MGSLDVGSNDFWAGIDVACILHYSWEGLSLAPAMDDAHIGVASGSNEFWAGIDVACILHYSWPGLSFAPGAVGTVSSEWQQ